MDVQVVRNGVGEVVEVRRIAPPEEVVDDPGLPRGVREVVDKGRAGEQAVVMRVHVINGEEIRREQVRAGATTPPEKRVVRVGSSDEATDGETTEEPTAPAAGAGRGTRSRSARPVATGRPTAATATTAACSSTARRGWPTAATPTPRSRTRPAAPGRSRWPPRCATTVGATDPGPPAPVSSGCRRDRAHDRGVGRPDAAPGAVRDARADQPPAERPGQCGGTIGGCVMRGGSQRVPVPVGPGQRRPPTAPRPPTRPTRSL